MCRRRYGHLFFSDPAVFATTLAVYVFSNFVASYSRRNVLTAHMRKHHGCSENESCNLVNCSDIEKLSEHCAICELDVSTFTDGNSLFYYSFQGRGPKS